MLIIESIQSDNGILDSIRQLFAEYMQELNEDLYFQQVDEEMDNPLKKYGPPQGGLLLARWNDAPAACVALQTLQPAGVCEMKRLYVRPAFRQHGIGDQLVVQIEQQAIALGYDTMVLDTLERLQPAIRLYERHGFNRTNAYYDNPLPGVVYMEKRLKSDL